MACEDCSCRQCIEARGECYACHIKQVTIDGLIQRAEEAEAEVKRLGDQKPITITQPCTRPHADDWTSPNPLPINPQPEQPPWNPIYPTWTSSRSVGRCSCFHNHSGPCDACIRADMS